MMKPTTKQRAFKYYCMGLNSKEIAKLLDLSYRTVQNYMSQDQWKAKRNPMGLPVIVLKLCRNGMSYRQIGNHLNISRSKVYRCLQEMKKVT